VGSKISDEPGTTMFMEIEYGVAPECCCLTTKLHGVTYQKTNLDNQCRENLEYHFFLIVSMAYGKWVLWNSVETSVGWKKEKSVHKVYTELIMQLR
jgi:hypothetical protein